jgi:uncharacterized protein
MPEKYSYPGVYIQETPNGVHPIQGVATSIAAFIGQAAMGPIGQAIECHSYADYTRNFGGPAPDADLAQSVQLFFKNGGSDCFVVRLANSATAGQTALGPLTSADYIGDVANRTGLYALDSVDLFNLMVLPGDDIGDETEWRAIRAAAAAYCHSRRAFLLLDAPAGWTKAGILNMTASDLQAFRTASGDAGVNCAVYYPRVQINDNGTLRYIGASGAIAGVFAAADSNRGVWNPPAGASAALDDVIGLEVVLTDAQNALLNPEGVNCLRSMPEGNVVWGARTAGGFDPNEPKWAYIPIRRVALFIEEAIDRGTQWAVFEPNGEPLWVQIRLSITSFMMGLFRQGAFQGASPSDAFFVKCDGETTTPADIAQGVVNIVVGFAPLNPAEFVVLKIHQSAGSGRAEIG